ncbi:MAG: hypothetical protein HZA47_08475 [Planctomycetes bacterium]|uniref:hypothetical protein n=1 Tax=Candidatus Wunengus sp. YC65 TaxID=3367701 RepID=UPI001DC3D99C|nr:hypothetical protein [Planctomycetota bacterium]
MADIYLKPITRFKISGSIYKIEPALIHRASVRWIKAQGFCAESTRNILKWWIHFV